MNRVRLTAGFGLLLVSAAIAAAPSEEDPTKVVAVYDCPAPASSDAATLTIEIDDRVPLAVVNEEDRPADYTPSHIRIQLDRGGDTLTIGRITGRILASRPGTDPVLLGRCIERIRT